MYFSYLVAGELAQSDIASHRPTGPPELESRLIKHHQNLSWTAASLPTISLHTAHTPLSQQLDLGPRPHGHDWQACGPVELILPASKSLARQHLAPARHHWRHSLPKWLQTRRHGQWQMRHASLPTHHTPTKSRRRPPQVPPPARRHPALASLHPACPAKRHQSH